MKFELVATDGAARAGRLTTPNGVVDTPIFMPVGTHAAVKALVARPNVASANVQHTAAWGVPWNRSTGLPDGSPKS